MKGVLCVLVVSVFALSACASTPAKQACACTSSDTNSAGLVVSDKVPIRLDLSDALAKVNQYRSEHDLDPVLANKTLVRIARAHAADLAVQGYISHKGSDGSTLADRLYRGGYDPVRASENISAGQRTFDSALAAWQGSKVHREKLLTDAVSEIGIAFIYDPEADYRVFWTMILAEPF